MATYLEQFDIRGRQGAANMNSVSFNSPALATRTISGTTYQVCAFVNDSLKMVLGWRVYPFGRWTLYQYNGSDQADLGTFEDDSHNTAVVAIDADGLVHICFNHHDDPINYRRSAAAIGSWTGTVTAAQSMVGTNESSVTYPMFIVSPDAKLYFAFRDGSSGNGDQYFYAWNDGADTWAAAAGTGTGGKLVDGVASGQSPYFNGAPKFTTDWDGAGTGYMHWSFMWRNTTALDNEDVSHVRWDATSWTKIGGSAQTVPITKANTDIVWTIASTADLLNQIDFDLTSAGRPVVGVIKKDGSAISQLYVLYYDGAAWQNQVITSYVSGDYTGWGRPMVLIDRTTNVCYMIGGNSNDSTSNIYQWTSDPADFTTWTKKTFYSGTNLGGAELNYDRKLWLDSRKISGVLALRQLAGADGRVRVFERHAEDYTSGSTFPSSWQRKHSITIDRTKVGSGGVSNFSVLLSRANFADEVCDPSSANKSQSDGGDLVFSSDSAGATRLACHVVMFGHDSVTAAADSNVEIYVNVPAITGSDGGADSVIYVWWKTAGGAEFHPFVDETYGQFAAYNSRTLFMPFSRQADNAAEDTQIQLRQGTPTYATGKVQQAMDGNGAEGVAASAPSVSIASAFSMAAWLSVDAVLTVDGQIMSNDETGTNVYRAFQFRVDQATGLVRLVRFDSGNNVVANFVGSTDLRNAGQKRVWATFDTSAGSAIFVNGASEATEATLTANNVLDSRFRIGFRRGIEAVADNFIKSLLDNLEIHTTRRTQAWITTDFNNQNSPSTFSTAGAAGATTSSVTYPALERHTRGVGRGLLSGVA